MAYQNYPPVYKDPAQQSKPGPQPTIYGAPNPHPGPMPSIGGVNDVPGGASTQGDSVGGVPGFDFARWQANRMRPRPTMVLPGQGQGPMPVGTKPLPVPNVRYGDGKEPFIGGVMMGPGQSIHDGKGGYINYDAGRWGNPGQVGDPRLEMNDPRYGGPTLDTGDNRLDRGGLGMVTDLGDGRGGYNRTFPPRGMGQDPAKGGLGQGGPKIGSPVNVGGGKPQFDSPYSQMREYHPGDPRSGGKPAQGGPRMGGWNNQLMEGTPEYGDWVRRMKLQHGDNWTPGGNPMQAPGPGSSGPGMPSREGGASHRQALRPGMEYRPNGGQRPVGGGMQSGFPGEQGQVGPAMYQNGGSYSQASEEARRAYELQMNPQQGGFDPRMGSGYYGAF